MLLEWWKTNRKTVLDEIEDRTGQRPTTDNQILTHAHTSTSNTLDIEVDYVLFIFNAEIVAIVTVDWGEPALKISYTV